MDLAEARDLLTHRRCTLHEHAAAASYLSSYYAHEGKHLLRPVDLTKDAVAAGPFREGIGEIRADIRQARQPHNIGKIGGGDFPAGAELVMKLPGPVTAYFIAADAYGNACVYAYASIDKKIDPGTAITGSRFVKDARQRAAAEQARNKHWAAGVASFWAQQKQKTAARA
jgi:hypothetical protein